MSVFSKSDKYSLKEKEELTRIITKNKIAYEEELSSRGWTFSPMWTLINFWQNF